MHHVDRSRTTALSRMDSMVAYAQTFQCRRYFLRTYYGESAPAQCGKCDVCLERHVPIHPTPKDEHVIKQLLMQIKQDGQPGTLPQTTAARREGLLRWLYQEGWIEQADPFRSEWQLTEKTRHTLKM
jgi:ATP-dependent DNA helicase RecQ